MTDRDERVAAMADDSTDVVEHKSGPSAARDESATRDERFFTKAHWLGVVDPRPFAIFRIAFGLVLLHDLVNFTRDLRAFITDEGMLPRGVQNVPWAWSIFDLVGSPFACSLIFAVGFLAVTAFTVGFQTRIATIASWFFLVSLHHRNVYITDGGDFLVEILLLWSCFADLGARYSVDAWRSKARILGGTLREGPRREISAIPALPVRLLQCHVAVLYFVSGILKARGGWLHGTAIYSALQLTGFDRPLGAWLLELPSLCRLLTLAALGIELSFPFFAMSPFKVQPARALAVVFGVGLQLGLLLAMKVGIFTETMIVVCILFVQPEWIDRVERMRGLAPTPGMTRARAFPRWLGAILVVQFVVCAWSPFLGKRIPLPQAALAELKWVGMTPQYDLFTKAFPVAEYQITGVREDGAEVDVLPVAVPGMQARVGWVFSRWYKFTFKDLEYPVRYVELGHWFCRHYGEVAGVKLRSIRLVRWVHPAVAPGEQAAPSTPEELIAESCDGL